MTININNPLIELQALTKVYGTGHAAMHALRGIDLRIDRGSAFGVGPPSLERRQRRAGRAPRAEGRQTARGSGQRLACSNAFRPTPAGKRDRDCVSAFHLADATLPETACDAQR